MNLPTRFYALLVILGVLIAAVVLVGGNGGVLSSQAPLPPELGVDLIAYVDMEGQVFTIDPDNSTAGRRISSEDGFFTWPVWSPDASQIAFSGVSQTTIGISPLTLYVSDTKEGEPKVIYVNERGTGPVLESMPHYTLWAPNSRLLSFMASVPQGLTLFIDDVRDDTDAKVILRNSPLYASWSDSSRYMLVHAGVEHFLIDAETDHSVESLTRRSLGYRTPAWQPRENRVAFLEQGASGTQSLLISDMDTEDLTLIDVISVHAAFLWSPNGRSLAVAESPNADGFLNQSLSIYSPDGTKRSASLEENIIAFFWSPDSTKIAYITPTSTRGLLRLKILDVNSGDTWPLAEFSPTRDQNTVYSFFDQFAHSQTPWSPDSTALVFAGSLLSNGVSISQTSQPTSQVYVVGANPNPTIHSIADGGLAFWSPK